MPVRALLAVFALLICSAALHGADTVLALRKGDRIAIIGSAVADRMQHDAWFESLIYRAYPDLDLTVRTLAAPCDEVVTRLRTETGATRDAWLARLDCTVVLAFYGFNESFAGPAGLPQFTQDLHGFIAAIRAAHGSTGQAPRLVLISPTAAEDLHDANLAAPGPLNANLAAYAAAMAAVAKADAVPFVDLFATSQQLYGAAAHPLTFNGIHLTETGDEVFAPPLFQAVFGVPPPLPSAALETLRAAVVDKNETWFHRYRTVDSYNIYGDRSRIGYESGPGGPKLTNAQVMEPEMAVRDALTVKRDRRIWAVAQGGDLALDEAGLPEVPVVKTNLPGSGPDGTHPYLGAEAAIAHMTLAKGCKANLFASEEQFPELVKPVQMAWDTRGRLWVSVWPNYPERTPTSTVGDRILILEDTDGDGKADKMTTFIDGLNCPTGFQFYKDGILLMQSPDLWFVRDTDGDGKADWKERVLMGLDAADSHHETNSMVVDQGGAMYLSDGWFMRTQIETAQGPVRNVDAAIYRYEPLSQRFERYVPYDFANPHGRVFDGWGTDIITDGTGNENFFAPAFSGHIDYPGRHPRMQQFWNRPSRPCAGTCILSSRHFPEEFQGNFLDCNVIGMQGVFRARVREEGSGLAGDTLENLVSSDDRTFRPSGVNVGPDGAVYVMDWSNAIVGHLQHHLRDPNRDHVHGRIYRITYEGRPLLAPARIADQPVAALLELLTEPEDNVRARAQLELGKRDPATVLAAVDAWAAKLDPAAAGFARNQLYALWTHQWFNAVDLPLLRRLLRAPDHHVRAAATRVLCYWRDRVPEVVALLRVQAEDEHPRVRLEAVRACSFLRQWEAGDVALLALKRPHDYYVDYCLKETMRQLEPWVRPALTAGSAIAAGNPEGMAYLLAGVGTGELATLPPGPAVWQALVTRADTPPPARLDALRAWAAQRGATPLATLLEVMQGITATDAAALATASATLLSLPAAELAVGRNALTTLRTPDRPEPLRRAAIAALMTIDGSVDRQWELAGRDPAAIGDALGAVTMIAATPVRASAAPHVLELLGAQLAQRTPAVPPDQVGRLRRAALDAAPACALDPAQLAAALAALLAANEEVPSAVRCARHVPLPAWTPALAATAVDGIARWVRGQAVAQRGRTEVVDALACARELTGRLGETEARAARAALKELGVEIIILTTVREQMRYDRAHVVVEAGKPFQLILRNADSMPHNLVVVTPGNRARIGQLAAGLAATVDGEGRAFVPQDPAVLAATRLVEPGQERVLRMTAPTAPGEYEYLCTFPGHYLIMWGTLTVTGDVEGYLRDHPP